MGFTNEVTRCDILIEDLNIQVITDILDIDIDGLIPLGLLALIVGSFGANSLIACVDDDVGVHLAERFGIALQRRFNDVNAEFAGSHYELLFYL